MPGLKTVAKDVKVTYRLVNPAREVGQLQHSWRWMITYNHRDGDGDDPDTWTKWKDDAGRSIHKTVFTKKWDKLGRHLVECIGKNRRTDKYVVYTSFEQQVETLEAILVREMAEARKTKPPNPRDELKMLKKWYLLLRRLGKQQAGSMNDVAKREHEKRLAEIANNGKKLSALLKKCKGHIIPFHAVYLAKESMEETELRVFLATPRGREKTHVMIVDWTNLDEPRLHGMHLGTLGKNKWTGLQEGFRNAVRTWEGNNRYWPGGIRYEIDRGTLTEKGTIKTDGKDFTEELVDFLGKIARGAALLALVLIPISGVLAGAMIVTSMVAGTTGSVLSITHRHAHGEGDGLDDAIDVLDIVGNVFGVGYRAGKSVLWQAGKTLRIRVGKRVVKAIYIGEVMADGFNGMLLGVQFVGRYKEITEATHLMPEERASALLELFKDAAEATALHGLNNKVASTLEKAKWKKLLDSSDTEDFTEDPSFRGDTADGEKKVTVVNKQKRHEAAGVQTRKGKGKKRKKKKYKGQPARPPEERGMRDRDDEVFAQHTRDTDDIIIVRNSNPSALEHIGKPGCKPKPLEMKAKTRKTPPNEGLAAADPSDPRLQTMLKEKGITYEQYVKSIEADGFVVGPAKDGYLVMDKQGNKFYSDYDLHGVYDKKTGRDSYSEAKREQLNKGFGAELIQHPPHDNWPERNNPKMAPNDGPQGNSTAYIGGQAYHLETIADMKAFYKAHGIPWEEIYPNH